MTDGHIVTNLFYPVFFVLKRIVFAATCIYLREQFVLQMLVFSLSTISMLLYVMLTWPKESSKLNWLEILNECLSLVVVYHLIIFS